MTYWSVLCGDAQTLASQHDEHVELGRARAIVTSPPYWRQREYDGENASDEFGNEPRPELFVERLCDLFDALVPWLLPEASLWLNLGDTYVKNVLQLIPARVALGMMARGWRVRSEVIFERENFTPRPSPGRPQRSHEHVFLMSRHDDYFYDDGYMREPAKYAGYHYVRDGARADDGRLRMDGETTVGDTRIMRSVWRGPTGWNADVKHPAVMSRVMAERCVLSVTKPGDVVLDPFCGSGTTGVIALENDRSFVGFERVERYVLDSRARLRMVAPLLVTEI